MITRFDHVAVAVRELRPAIRLFRDVLGGHCVQAMSDDDRFDTLQFQYRDGSRIELIAPGATPGFVDHFLAARGSGLHHLTFFVDDLREAVERCRTAGYRVVDEDYSDAQWMEAFLSPRATGGVLIQLAQSFLDLAGQDARWSISGGAEEVIRRAEARGSRGTS